MMPAKEKALTAKELAAELGRTVHYVYFMTRRGFVMPNRKATLSEARAWLARNPAPRSRTHWPAEAPPTKRRQTPVEKL